MILRVSAALLSLAFLQSAQSGTRSAGVIQGQVVDHGTGRPIAGAAVTISGRAGLPTPPVVVADTIGRFSFRDLPPGTFTLTATAVGYLSGGDHIDDGMAPAVQSVEIKEGGALSEVMMRLLKPGAISGMVLDDADEPLDGVDVLVLQVSTIAGLRRLTLASGDQSDDRGHYRFARLSPGEYVVCAFSLRSSLPLSAAAPFERAAGGSAADRMALDQSLRASAAFISVGGSAFQVGRHLLFPGNASTAATGPFPLADGRMLTAPNACYAGTHSPAEATVMQVESGQQRAGIDLRIALQPSTSVSGHVVGPSGPLPHQGVRLQAEGADALGWLDGVDFATTATDATGAFMFLAVPPGTYQLRALYVPQPAMGSPPADLPDGDTLGGAQKVSVGDQPVAGLTLTMQRGARVSGRLVFSGAGTQPSGAESGRVALGFPLADGGTIRIPFLRPRAVVAADGSFRSTGLVPARYVLEVADVGLWTLESALRNDIDISDVPFDANGDDLSDVVITMTDRPSVVSGTVRDTKGVPAGRGRVVVFPVDRERWTAQGPRPRRQHAVEVSEAGTFTLRGLPAGEYLAVAVPSSDRSAWQTPAFFAKAAPSATKLTLTARASQVLDLTIGTAR